MWRSCAGDGLRRAARCYHTIQAIPRELKGNRVSARDRAQGRIPAVVFTQSYLQSTSTPRPLSRKHLLTTEKKQIQAILDSVQLPFFCSTTFPLQIRAGSGSSTLLDSGNVLPIKASILFIYRFKEQSFVFVLSSFMGFKRNGVSLKCFWAIRFYY